MKNLFGALLCGAVLALGMGPFASAADAKGPMPNASTAPHSRAPNRFFM